MGDVRARLGGILVGGDRDQAQKQSVEHTEAGEHVADDVVGPAGVFHELPQDGTQEDQPRPVEADEHRDHQDREGFYRQIVDPVKVVHGSVPGLRRGGRRKRVIDATNGLLPPHVLLDGFAV